MDLIWGREVQSRTNTAVRGVVSLKELRGLRGEGNVQSTIKILRNALFPDFTQFSIEVAGALD